MALKASKPLLEDFYGSLAPLAMLYLDAKPGLHRLQSLALGLGSNDVTSALWNMALAVVGAMQSFLSGDWR